MLIFNLLQFYQRAHIAYTNWLSLVVCPSLSPMPSPPLSALSPLPSPFCPLSSALYLLAALSPLSFTLCPLPSALSPLFLALSLFFGFRLYVSQLTGCDPGIFSKVTSLTLMCSSPVRNSKLPSPFSECSPRQVWNRESPGRLKDSRFTLTSAILMGAEVALLSPEDLPSAASWLAESQRQILVTSARNTSLSTQAAIFMLATLWILIGQGG